MTQSEIRSRRKGEFLDTERKRQACQRRRRKIDITALGLLLALFTGCSVTVVHVLNSKGTTEIIIKKQTDRSETSPIR